MKMLPALLVGLGVGAVVGTRLGATATWPGIAVAVLGVGLAVFGSRAAAGDEAAARPSGEGPPLAQLGSRVEQILRLAEEQAENHRAEAARDAERTLAEARSAAQLIVDRARAVATGLTGTGPDWETPR
ncbi:hypothetical protein ABZV78_18480 [Micromonospora sp. NPDC004540]|uniref:hypothetical protein n=1 Tax=Micromonospora sp. NPDC004540 TaxID=3154457 RepID=UPI0033A5BEFC